MLSESRRVGRCKERRLDEPAQQKNTRKIIQSRKNRRFGKKEKKIAKTSKTPCVELWKTRRLQLHNREENETTKNDAFCAERRGEGTSRSDRLFAAVHRHLLAQVLCEDEMKWGRMVNRVVNLQNKTCVKYEIFLDVELGNLLCLLCACLLITCLPVCRSVGRSVYRSVGLSISRSVCVSVGRSVGLSVGLSACLWRNDTRGKAGLRAVPANLAKTRDQLILGNPNLEKLKSKQEF